MCLNWQLNVNFFIKILVFRRQLSYFCSYYGNGLPFQAHLSSLLLREYVNNKAWTIRVDAVDWFHGLYKEWETWEQIISTWTANSITSEQKLIKQTLNMQKLTAFLLLATVVVGMRLNIVLINLWFYVTWLDGE